MVKQLKNSQELLKKSIESISKLEQEKLIEIKKQDMGNMSENTQETAKKNEKTYKDAEAGIIDIAELKKAAYDLIDADEYVYKKAPNHELTKEEAEEFTKIILGAQKSLSTVLEAFGFEQEKNIINLDSDALYLVSNKKLIKILNEINEEANKAMGITLKTNLNIISTDGVLKPEDMLIINPKMPEKALKGIEKKCAITKENIQKIIANKKPSKVYVVVKEGDKADELILKRAEALYGAKKLPLEELQVL
ncbi:DUF2100 domain-containing protein [Methanococcus voltae]|uniref:Uncharacterized protein n=1 Tax=Methanococcus voltae (strain ATCC BAA-1334 / A3) TaxID=456320 RepID=D7DRW1_METV3|nr:DUF2100 domain-containing protein [Methanococcus voltae]MCS3901396.1 hypothetical protein [Methanococcus voltae]